jgi:hypothetical protein
LQFLNSTHFGRAFARRSLFCRCFRHVQWFSFEYIVPTWSRTLLMVFT